MCELTGNPIFSTDPKTVFDFLIQNHHKNLHQIKNFKGLLDVIFDLIALDCQLRNFEG